MSEGNPQRNSIRSKIETDLRENWRALDRLCAALNSLRMLREELEWRIDENYEILSEDEVEDLVHTYESVDWTIHSFESAVTSRTDIYLPERWDKVERLLSHVDLGPVDMSIKGVPFEQIRERINRICLSTVELIRIPQARLIRVSPTVIQFLAEDLDCLYDISDDDFEILIADRLSAMGMLVQRAGPSNRKDGGIDLIAVPKAATFPYVLAGQAKHHRSMHRTGVRDTRDFHGAINSQNSPFHLGMIVTNTTFTPDARFFAEQNKKMLRLRDFEDLRRWMENKFIREQDWKEIPKSIELAPGVVVDIPQAK